MTDVGMEGISTDDIYDDWDSDGSYTPRNHIDRLPPVDIDQMLEPNNRVDFLREWIANGRIRWGDYRDLATNVFDRNIDVDFKRVSDIEDIIFSNIQSYYIRGRDILKYINISRPELEFLKNIIILSPENLRLSGNILAKGKARDGNSRYKFTNSEGESLPGAPIEPSYLTNESIIKQVKFFFEIFSSIGWININYLQGYENSQLYNILNSRKLNLSIFPEEIDMIIGSEVTEYCKIVRISDEERGWEIKERKVISDKELLKFGASMFEGV